MKVKSIQTKIKHYGNVVKNNVRLESELAFVSLILREKNRCEIHTENDLDVKKIDAILRPIKAKVLITTNKQVGIIIHLKT